MGKFVTKKTNTGFVFRLNAANGQTIAVSEVYKTLGACRNGITSVAVNAPAADFEDLTVGEPARSAQKKNPKFELYLDRSGEFRFRLRARNGQIIAVSEGYVSRASCINGIESVRKNVVGAPTECAES